MGYTILVVEDISDSRELLRFLLESEGYRVLEAANGIDAVATAQRGQPDAILMDISLPLMDGCQATRRIRESGLLRFRLSPAPPTTLRIGATKLPLLAVPIF